MRGRDADVIDLDVGPFGSQLFGGVAHIPRHATAIDDDDGDALFAIVEDQCARMQLIDGAIGKAQEAAWREMKAVFDASPGVLYVDADADAYRAARGKVGK